MDLVTLEFFDRGGVVHFTYREEVRFEWGYRAYVASGAVPAEIAAQGVEAVKVYVDEQIRQIVGSKKERDRIFDENRRALNVSISYEHHGVLLEGRVVCRDDELMVDLETPVQGSEFLAWGSSRAEGHKVWAEPGITLTEEAIGCARSQLVAIYKRVTSPVKDLVKRLNEK